MAEVKHTPGPLIAVGSEVLKSLSDHSKLTLTVARCAGANEEAEANATLYAAAPDLFEALQSLATECSQVWSADEFPALKAAFAALSKATTQQEGR